VSKYIRKSESVDVMLLAEGTYPYIRGGVSSWIAQLMAGLPQIKFGICFVGAQESEYGDMRYTLPDNLVHLEVHYMFDGDTPPVQKLKGEKKSFDAVRELHRSFAQKGGEIPAMMQKIDFYMKEVTFEHFLYSEHSWEFLNECYMKNCPDVPFIDYFWTLRNIHRPIWILARIVQNFPTVKLFHAPSTGYAGFLGALGSYTKDVPYILTEHGIYTRERKIDMLSADWVSFRKSPLLKQPEEFNYIKKMWVNFFEKIGEFSYKRASHILSLYPGAQKIQISFGAQEAKTKVIPNGVDVDALKATMQERIDPPKPIITLIGRVVSIKDIKTFIRAMRITINEIPEAEGWIVGPTDEDPEYFHECEQMVESLGLNGKVKFLGFQNIKEILPQSALQTLTSISEGMPLVILEGFAAGVPCVATDVGSCRDLIYGGLNEEDIGLGAAGAITHIANPSELAKAYIRFLSDFALWKQAQEVALERVEKYYRQEMFLEEYRALYAQSMNKEESWRA